MRVDLPSMGGWPQGWCPWAHHLPSPNQGPRPQSMNGSPASMEGIDLLVIHSISLPPGEYGTGYVQAFFTNRLDFSAHPYFQTLQELRVSAHFFIERSGALWQFVRMDRRAWHAGQSCFEGRENCNDFSIGVELEGLEESHFEDPQYDTLGRLYADLVAHNPHLTRVAGHEDIAPGRKKDPGPGFDWRRAQSLGLPGRGA
jgi:AmpD protein